MTTEPNSLSFRMKHLLSVQWVRAAAATMDSPPPRLFIASSCEGLPEQTWGTNACLLFNKDEINIPGLQDDKILHLLLINIAQHKFCHYPSSGVLFCLNISVWLCGVWHLYSFVWQICAPTCKKRRRRRKSILFSLAHSLQLSWFIITVPFPLYFFYQPVSIALGFSSW